jgi:phosphoribosylanthranilate isomerase
VLVQIYGVTTAEDAEAVDELGPDHIGVVLDEGVDTWDSVDEGTARDISAKVRSARVVALSLSTDPRRIRRTADCLRPGILHLARAAGGMAPEAVAGLRRDVAPVEMMVTIPVRGVQDRELARRFAEAADYLLLDTADPATGVVGATGISHEWSLSAVIAAAVDVPVILAGGLGPDNVVEAIRRVRPKGVDSETRTSRSDDRRRKDLGRVRAFIDLARSAGG